MKRWSLLIIPAAAAFSVFFLRDRTDPPAQTDHSPKPALTQDPSSVFQKAFWKRPTEADRILHAERREWTEAGDIRKWEWFLVVKPSPPLIKHLIGDNAFNLPACPTPPPPDGAPPWFTYDPTGLKTIGTPRAGMRLSYDEAAGILFASDRGGGFQPGVPETPQAASTALPDNRRLSASPPPDPRKP